MQSLNMQSCCAHINLCTLLKLLQEIWKMEKHEIIDKQTVF